MSQQYRDIYDLRFGNICSNSEDPDEMPHEVSSESALLQKKKKKKGGGVETERVFLGF